MLGRPVPVTSRGLLPVVGQQKNNKTKQTTGQEFDSKIWYFWGRTWGTYISTPCNCVNPFHFVTRATSASCDPWLSVGPFFTSPSRYHTQSNELAGENGEKTLLCCGRLIFLVKKKTKKNFCSLSLFRFLCVCLADLQPHEEKESVGQQQSDFGWPSRGPGESAVT